LQACRLAEFCKTQGVLVVSVTFAAVGKEVMQNQLSCVALSLSLLAFQNALAVPYMEDAITTADVGSNLASAAPWGGSSTQIKVASGNLTNSPLLALSPAGNMANIAGTGGGSSYRAFSSSAVPSGTVYYSFLVQCTSLPTSGDKYLTGLLPGGTTSPGGSSDPLAVYMKLGGTSYQVGIRKSGATTSYAPTPLALNTTNLIVAKYTLGPGAGDDVVSLYINPTPGVVEPASPDVTLTGGTDASNLQNVYLKSSSGYGVWNFDTLRVGPTWTDVSPLPVEAPPAILTQPLDVTTYAHSNATFSVVVSNLQMSSCQWAFNGTNISEATSSSLTIVNVTQHDLGSYCVTVTNSLGSVTSSNAMLSMYPFVATPFLGLDTYWGQTNTLSVGAWGTGPLRYQWYQDGMAVPDATNSTLTLAAIQFTNAGLYFVVVSSLLGCVTNPPAQVVVNPANVSLNLCPDVVIQGTVGYNYIIESSTDLSNTNAWIVETNMTLAQPIQYWDDINVDTSRPDYPRKFYRVLPGP
jgi:hypothetical protein